MTKPPTLNAHLLSTPEEPDLTVLRECLESSVRLSLGERIPDPAHFTVLVGGRPTREQMEASESLRALVIPYAGLPAETRELLGDFPGIAVFNLHHNAPVTAEMALALLLAAAKLVVPMDRALRENHWSGRGAENRAVLLTGKQALVLGYGAIGRRVARSLDALGMAVRAIRRGAGAVTREGSVTVHPPADLPALLSDTTALVVCVPLTEETRGLVGERELSLLPPGAVLVNVARGAVVAEEPLYRALESGRLHSAGLDVWYRYPGREGDPKNTPPSEFPFGDLENVVLSPHRGGWLHEVEALRMRDLAALLNRLAAGVEPPGRVDVAAGY